MCSWKHVQRRPRTNRGRKGGGGTNRNAAASNQWVPPPKGPTEGVEGVDDLRKEHYDLAFHVQYSVCPRRKRKRNCIENPNCLFGLGEEEEGIWLSEPNLGDNPEEEARDLSSFVGISNLGATCYMGSLLQCLYMNKNFRQGVFDWTEEKEAPDAVCKELQLLFADLQSTNQKKTSPYELSQALNVSHTVQQDAQEFNKLFISYLEERYARCERESVKNLMKQFYGQCVYVTTCETCHSVSESGATAFHELELNMKGLSSVEDCLQHFLKEERLTESNKYFCEKCNGLQDATRSVSILSLPEVLNIQLLRFVYDTKEEMKKKLTASVSFPLELDMSAYCTSKEKGGQDDKSDKVYLLTGVLIHIGTSAYGGHYIAHIRDESSNEWWEFDDHSVRRIEKEMVGVQSSQQKNAKRRKAKEKEENRAASSNAYMLIYAKANREIVTHPTPPQESLEMIEKRNLEFTRRREEHFKACNEEKKRMEQHRKEYESIVHALPAKPTADRYHWISADWLRGWVIGKTELGEIDNKDILCEHGKLSPIFVSKMKRISIDGWNFLYKRYKGGPILTEKDYCPECVLHYCKELAEESAAERKKSQIIHRLGNNPDPKDGYWISTEWLNKWKRKNTEDLSSTINEAITCEHGNLQAKEAGRRIVSVEIWSYLRSLYEEGPEFPSSFEGCRLCREDSTKREEERQLRLQTRADEKKELAKIQKLNNPQNKLPVGSYFLAPYEWYDEWKKFVSDMEVDEPPQSIDNTFFLCEHEGLCIDPSVQTADTPSSDKVCFLPENIWTLCRNQYGGDPEICYNVGQNEVITEPSICEECLRERQQQHAAERKNFKNGIVIVTTADRNASQNSRSRRRRGAKREEIMVSSTDNIYHLRLKIFEQMGIAPAEQRLFFGDVELKNPTHTLQQYNVGLKDVIHLEQQELASDQFDAMMMSPSGVKETGFAGTSLHSGPRSSGNDHKQPDNESPVAVDDAEWSCAQCTYNNKTDAMICEMCENPKP